MLGTTSLSWLGTSAKWVACVLQWVGEEYYRKVKLLLHSIKPGRLKRKLNLTTRQNDKQKLNLNQPGLWKYRNAGCSIIDRASIDKQMAWLTLLVASQRIFRIVVMRHNHSFTAWVLLKLIWSSDHGQFLLTNKWKHKMTSKTKRRTHCSFRGKQGALPASVD